MTVNQEPPELVAMRLSLGQQLASQREAAGIVQQQIGHRTGYSRSSIAKAEAGRQLLTWEFWKTADDLLKAEGNLLASYERVRRAKQEHEAQAREAELAKAYAEAQARAEELRATAIPSETHSGNDSSPPHAAGRLVAPPGPELVADVVLPAGVELAEGFAAPFDYFAFLSSAARCAPGEQGDRIYDQLTKFLRQWAGIMNRRELFELFGWATAIIAALPAIIDLGEEEQERLARAIVTPNRVDAQVIDHLAAILHYCKQQDDVLGPRAVLHTVLTQRWITRHLLPQCPAELHPRLLSLYSSMSSSVGDYSFDLNDLDSARYYYDQARAAAHEARNTEFSVYALCSMSYTASIGYAVYGQGKAHVGIDLAAAAQKLAIQTDDPLLRVCAAERAGTAHAVSGQYKLCLTEFDRAREGLLSGTNAPPESPAYYYHEGLLASHQSECLLLLGNPKAATMCATSGLAVFNKSYVDGYALCALHLGNARLRLGEIEEAVRVIGDAAILAAQNRQPRLVKALRTARGRLQPWHSTAAVKELDEGLRGMGFGGQWSG
ncbi:MAG: helix-turn-helix domain-containing protein [Pseudonocardiaceae bacterium]